MLWYFRLSYTSAHYLALLAPRENIAACFRALIFLPLATAVTLFEDFDFFMISYPFQTVVSGYRI
jgi:hypothetical protein